MDGTCKPNCPFCPANGEVEVIDHTDQVYLVAALHPETREVMPDRYFVVPHDHVERIRDLPLEFLQHAVILVDDLAPGVDRNLTINDGEGAGQRLPHAHMWVMLRRGEEGLPSENLGFATVLERLNASA